MTTARNGKYAANGLITYVFDRDGRFKGWSIGGSFRWRSANAIGYERDLTGATGVAPNTILVDRPIKRDDWYELGSMISYQRRLTQKMDLKVQLNINNLLDNRDAHVVSADTDILGVYGARDAVVPIRWELRQPRNFVLTTTLEF